MGTALKRHQENFKLPDWLFFATLISIEIY